MVGYEPARNGNLWVPSPDAVARQKVIAFFGHPEDQSDTLIQVCPDDMMSYFYDHRDDEAHNRVWICYEAILALWGQGGESEAQGGFGCLYVAATNQWITDDRILVWRKQPDDYATKEKFGWGKYPMDLTGNQFLEQVVDWSAQHGIRNNVELSEMLGTVPGIDNNALLNFFHSFKPYQQETLWGSLDANVDPWPASPSLN
jgi:hypothetical protein